MYIKAQILQASFDGKPHPPEYWHFDWQLDDLNRDKSYNEHFIGVAYVKMVNIVFLCYETSSIVVFIQIWTNFS